MHEWKNFIQELCSKLFQHQLANKAHIFCRCPWNVMFQSSVEPWKYFPWKAASLYWLHELFLANPFQTVLKIQIWKFQLMNHGCIFMVFSSMFMAFSRQCCNKQRFHWHNPWMFAILIMAAVKESCWTEHAYLKIIARWHSFGTLASRKLEWIMNQHGFMYAGYMNTIYIISFFDYIPNVMNQSFQVP